MKRQEILVNKWSPPKRRFGQWSFTFRMNWNCHLLVAMTMIIQSTRTKQKSLLQIQKHSMVEKSPKRKICCCISIFCDIIEVTVCDNGKDLDKNHLHFDWIGIVNGLWPRWRLFSIRRTRWKSLLQLPKNSMVDYSNIKK